MAAKKKIKYVRITAARWDRFFRERDNRPSEGAPDLYDTVEQLDEKTVVMPLTTAEAFGLNPDHYVATELK